MPLEFNNFPTCFNIFGFYIKFQLLKSSKIDDHVVYFRTFDFLIKLNLGQPNDLCCI